MRANPGMRLLAFTISLVAVAFGVATFQGRTPAPGAPPAPAAIPEWVPPLLAILTIAGLVAWLLMPLIKAWAKRIEGRVEDPMLTDELAQMRERLTELEMSGARIAELEDRVDFAERLLAQRHDEPQLPMYRTPV